MRMKKNPKREVKEIRIVVHDKTIHADEVFAVAILIMYLKILHRGYKLKVELIRSRDPEVWNKADYVVDVGMVYEPPRLLDHHQSVAARKVGKVDVPYASAGILWKLWGAVLCQNHKAAQIVEEKFIRSIDVQDNGGYPSFKKYKGVEVFTVSSLVAIYNPLWNDKGADSDKALVLLVAKASTILRQTIKYAKSVAEELVENASRDARKQKRRYIVLEYNAPWRETIHRHATKKMLYVICRVLGPKKERWVAYCIEDRGEHRKSFPANWAGLEGQALKDVTGVTDALFCHSGRFTCGATSRKGIIKLVEFAIAAD